MSCSFTFVAMFVESFTFVAMFVESFTFVAMFVGSFTFAAMFVGSFTFVAMFVGLMIQLHETNIPDFYDQHSVPESCSGTCQHRLTLSLNFAKSVKVADSRTPIDAKQS